MKKLNTIQAILVSLMAVGCSSDSNATKPNSNMVEVQPSMTEQSTTVDDSAHRGASNNGFFVDTIEEFGSDGILYKSIRYTINYAENTLTAVDLLADSQPVEHVFGFNDSGDLTTANYFITSEPSLVGQALLQVTYTRDAEGRLLEGQLQYQYGNESDSTTLFDYNDDGRLEGFTSTYEETFDIGQGEVAADVETGQYFYDADNQLTSFQVTDREVSGLVFTTTLTSSEGRIQTESRTTNSPDIGANETITYFYDGSGNVTSADTTDDSGNVILRAAYTYSMASEPVFNLTLEALQYQR